MNPPRSCRQRQRGIVTIWAVIFLIVGVIITLTQSLIMSGTSGLSNTQQMDSTAALFVAESGLERARGILQTNPATQCNSTAFPSSAFNVGRGNFTYAAPAYTTTACPGTASTSCCSITVTGNIGSSSRTLRLDIAITADSGGVSGTGGANPTDACTTNPIATQVTNPLNVPAVVLSVLGYNQHIAGGAPLSSRNCTPPVQTVVLNSQNFESNANRTLAGVRGNIYDVGSLGTIPILQGLDLTSHYSLVSVIFPQLSGASLVKLDTYWNDIKHRTANTGTERLDSITGSTNSGVVNNTDVCDTPLSLGIAGTFTPSYHGNKQSCNSWCYGGDTLAFNLVHGGVSNISNVPQGGVTFNTASTPAQNISMTRQAHLNSPNNDDKSIYSEIWYAYNPNLSPNLMTPNASSYKGNGTGAIGATWGAGGNGGSDSNYAVDNAGTPTLFVGTFANYAAGEIISPGDSISSSGGSGNINCTPTCPTVVRQLTSTETGGKLGGRGTYELSISQTVSASNGRNWTASSNVLNITACTVCFFASPDPVSGLISGRTISSQLPLYTANQSGTGFAEAAGGIGRYVLSGTPTTVASGAVKAGTAGTTIYLPASPAPSMPTLTTPPTRIAVYSGPGVLAANTTINSLSLSDANAVTKQFTVATAPTTPLDLATICGGTCAFFDNPSSASATTTFTVDTGNTTENANTHWAGGFTCLSGVDSTRITTAAGSSSPTAANWHEVVR